MLKPIIAAACLCTASLAAAPSQAQSPAHSQAHSQSGLSGQQISELVAGATVEIETPVGTKLPVSYARDGKVTGQAGELAWYLGAATDSGRWWVVADQLCHRWARWFNSEPQCIRLSRRGRIFHWRTEDGSSGTARIAARATIEAAAVPTLLRPGRILRFAPPAEAAPATAPAPETKAPAAGEGRPSQQAAAKEPAGPAPAAGPPAAEAPPVPSPVPSLVVPPAAALAAPPPPAPVADSAWPPQHAVPQARSKPVPPHPLFKVANVRHDDVLNVRSGPSADHDIVAELPPGSRGIAIVSECRSRWCPVQVHATTGWVNSAYLAPELVPVALPVALHGHADAPPGPPRDSPEAPRACLTQAARALLDRIEQNFGRVEVVSTCRPGAFIAGTGRPSRHASGNAVDFKAGARKPAILEWLIANHRSGGIMTYAGMDHIHVDIGPRFVSLAGGAHWSSWSRRARD